MKKIIYSFSFSLALLVALTSGSSAQQLTSQSLPEFGEEACGILETDPANMLDLIPLNYITRAALSMAFGGENELRSFLMESGTSIEELIDMSLEESGMLEEDAGAEYFGNEPVAFCNWSEPVTIPCNNMFSSLADVGLMMGTINASEQIIRGSAQEFDLSACATIKLTTDLEELDLALMQFDDYWYMVGSLSGESADSNLSMDYSSPSRNGSTSLTGNFRSPYSLNVAAGGQVNVSGILGNCVGYVNPTGPDFELSYSADNAKLLSIYVSGGTDTTLIINDPNGNWHCNDDFNSASGTNPAVEFTEPLSGVYDIWVGTYSQGNSGNTVELNISSRGLPW